MKKIKLDIVGLSYSQTQSGAYALVLGEIGGNRRLPIIIGGFEAQAIAVEIEKMQPSRPLTHDLFKSFADSFDILVEEVLIYDVYGRQTMCQQVNETTSQQVVDVADLKAGVYFVKIVTDNGEVVKRFVKK